MVACDGRLPTSALCVAAAVALPHRGQGPGPGRGHPRLLQRPGRSRAPGRHGAMTADFAAIRAVAERVADRLRGADEVHVTSPAGTDVTMRIDGREPKGWCTGIVPQPGRDLGLPRRRGVVAAGRGHGGRRDRVRAGDDRHRRAVRADGRGPCEDGFAVAIEGGDGGGPPARHDRRRPGRHEPRRAGHRPEPAGAGFGTTSPSRRSGSAQRISPWETTRAATAGWSSRRAPGRHAVRRHDDGGRRARSCATARCCV